MFQQIIAVIVILFFLSRLFWQRKKGGVSGNEFLFWLAFWTLSIAAIVSVKSLDRLAASFGISSSGIDILSYIAILVLFYLVFRIRIRLEKFDRNLTVLARSRTLESSKDK